MPENVTLKIFGTEECSELFARTFCSSGSIEVECTACGRVHFYDDRTYFDNREEYDQLKKDEEENPEKYLGRGTDMVSWFNFGGKQVVADCPCNFARFIEETLWDERYRITGYLKARADEEKAFADQAAASAEAAHEAVRGN